MPACSLLSLVTQDLKIFGESVLGAHVSSFFFRVPRDQRRKRTHYPHEGGVAIKLTLPRPSSSPPLSLSLESAYLGPPLPEEKRRRRKEAFSSMRTFFFLVCLSVDLKPWQVGGTMPSLLCRSTRNTTRAPLSSSSYLFPSPVSPRHTIQCPALLIQRFHQREEE